MKKKIPWKELAWVIPLWLLMLAAGFQMIIFWAMWLNGGHIELNEPILWIRQVEFIAAVIIFGIGLVSFFRAVKKALND